MVRKTGNPKIFISLLALINVIQAHVPTIKLDLLDKNRSPIEVVGASVPFYAQISVTNIPKNATVSLIKFHHQSLWKSLQFSQGKQFVIDNNQQTVSKINFTYLLTHDQIGTFKLGPFDIDIDGKIYSSNLYHIKVIEKESFEKKYSSGNISWIEPIIKTKEPFFAGQAIAIIYNLYLDDQSQFIGFEKPTSSQCTIYTDQRPTYQIITKNNKKYHVISLNATIFSSIAGEQTLPSLKAHIAIHDWQGGMFSGFTSFFSSPEEQIINSPTVSLNILKLPEPMPAHINLVGTVSSFDVTVNQTKASQGEGIVVQLKIARQAQDIKYLSAPKLNLIPELNSYESRTEFDEKQSTKIFEYIIQATKMGEITIPSQKLIIFDPLLQLYKNFDTNPVTLSIEEGKNGPEDNPLEIVQAVSEIKTEDPSSFISLLPITKNNTKHQSPKQLPWLLFGIIIIISLIISLIILGMRLIQYYIHKYQSEIKKHRAFKQARRSLNFFEEQNDTQSLYQLFIKLTAARMKKKNETVTEEEILSHLHNQGISSEKIKTFHEFFTQIAKARYFTPDSQTQALFARARYWLLQLEQII